MYSRMSTQRPHLTGTLISKVQALSGSGMCEPHAKAESGNIFKNYVLELMAVAICGEMPTVTTRKIVEKMLSSPTSTSQSHCKAKPWWFSENKSATCSSPAPE